MAKNKKLRQIESGKYWGALAKGYLKLAEQGFLFLKVQKNIGRKKLFSKHPPIYFFEEGNLIIASIWNVKHSLELFVKALGTNFDKQYWENHDLLFLFNDVKNKIDGLSLKRDLEMLEKLVNKYYNCRFIDKTIYRDVNNDYFRYPEINGAYLDYSFVHDLKRKDVNQFLKDIHNIKRAYELLEAELSAYRSSYKLYKKEVDKMLLKVATVKKPGYKK